MASVKVADFLLRRLREWGVEHVFGYPGDGINGLLAAWGRAGNEPQFVQARHEEMSAFEAVGYAKFTGRVGVCMATSGPGAIHLLNGLYDAKLDHVPVVAIVGQTNRSAMGGSYQQEVDLLSLYKDVASDYVQMVTVPEQLPGVLDRAIRVALAERAPTAIIVPADVQELEYSPPTHEFKMVPVEPRHRVAHGRTRRRGGPRTPPRSSTPATRSPSWSARERGAPASEVEQVAELLGAGVAKALLGKDVLSDELPYVTGSIGLLGTRPSYEMMMGCDTLLTVGSNFPYTQFLPEFGQARAVQIDIDAQVHRHALSVRGQPRRRRRYRRCGRLIPRLQRKSDRSWRDEIEVERGSVVGGDATPRRWSTPSRSTRCDCSTSCRHGSPTTRSSRPTPDLRPTGMPATCGSGAAMRGSLSGKLATMGPGRSLRHRCQVRAPDRPVIVFAGDGAMQMNGLAELITVKRYWQEWADPRLIVAVLHNNDLNQVTWEMRAMEGSPKFVESQELPDVDYAGVRGRPRTSRRITVTSPTRSVRRGTGRWRAERPTVLDVHTDPNVPPIPPHATFEQMKDMAAALLKGDEDRWSIIKEGAKVKMQEFLPHSHR